MGPELHRAARAAAAGAPLILLLAAAANGGTTRHSSPLAFAGVAGGGGRRRSEQGGGGRQGRLPVPPRQNKPGRGRPRRHPFLEDHESDFVVATTAAATATTARMFQQQLRPSRSSSGWRGERPGPPPESRELPRLRHQQQPRGRLCRHSAVARAAAAAAASSASSEGEGRGDDAGDGGEEEEEEHDDASLCVPPPPPPPRKSKRVAPGRRPRKSGDDNDDDERAGGAAPPVVPSPPDDWRATSPSAASSPAVKTRRKKKEPVAGVTIAAGGKLGGGGSGGGGGPLLPADAEESVVSQQQQRRRRPPKYNGNALALDVLSNLYFYRNKASAEGCEAERKEHLDGKTVEEVRQEYGEKLDELAEAIGAIASRVRAYFAAAAGVVTVEQVLHDWGIIPLNEFKEVTTFRNRFIEGLPSVKALWKVENAPDTRSMALCFVTGSSGSGKTFFSLSELREFRNDERKALSCVLYLRAGVVPQSVDYSDLTSAPEALVREVQTRLNKFLSRRGKEAIDFSRGRKLSMHICTVLDECSAPRLGKFFHHDSMTTIQELIALLESKLADSVTLVAAGTGTLGSTYDSKKEAHFFRMKPWGPEDLRYVLDCFKAKRQNGLETIDTLSLKAHESTDALADAINAHPWLDALTTNGRSTYFLCDIIARLSQLFPFRGATWHDFLGEWTPYLVEHVVHRYMSSNGLHGLGAGDKAKAAAVAFGALDSATAAPELPDLGGLDASERRAAMLLLEPNVVVADRRPRLLGGEARSVSVTPAVAVVLFNMAGITARMVASWKSEEQMAVLFAARRWILDRLREYEPRAAALDTGSQQFLDLKEGFGTLLTKLRLLRLERPVRHINGEVYIPMVTRNHLLLMLDTAFCANVIAPFMILRCRRSVRPDEAVVVDLSLELEKCGLLLGSDDRLLRGLLAVWQGTFDNASQVIETPRPLVDGTERIDLQKSPTFPENLLKYRRAADPVQYATVGSEGSTMLVYGDQSFRLPTIPDDAPITFVLVTNVKQIKFKLSEDKELAVTAKDLTDDMKLDHLAIATCLDPTTRKNVDVKVWFTNAFGG